MRNLIRISSCFLFFNSMAQVEGDLVFIKNKKFILKYVYLDSTFRVSPLDSSSYKVLSYYNIKKDTYERKPRYYNYEYKIETQLNKMGDSSPYLLDGHLYYYYDNRIQIEELYEHGVQKKFIEHIYEVRDTLKEKQFYDVFYFDSLKNNKAGTFLVYEYREGVAESKHYCCDDKPKDKIYLQEHERFYSRFKPRIAYSYQNRDFFEYGITREHLTGAKMKNGTSISYDSPNFIAYSFSLMNSIKRDNNIFGQRLTLSYITWFIRTDIGIMHLSDFKTSDYRPFAGAGFTAFGRFNVMYHYAFSLNNSQIPNLSRHTLTIAIF